jgi:hypothetical protein
MHSDVMMMDGKESLLLVCIPLQLNLCMLVKDESEQVLGTGLQGQLQSLRERGFTPKANVVNMDPHSKFVRPHTKYPGVLIDVGGAKDFVPVADAKIRRLKKTYHTVKAGLAWKLPPLHVNDLLAYCVSQMNLRQMSALHGIMNYESFVSVYSCKACV